MKLKNIKAGKTYRNKNAGTTQRTVVKIILNPPKEDLPYWYSSNNRPESEPVVVFTQNNRRGESRLYLKSFKAWAGEEVK